MISTLKTYASKERTFSLILSYAEKPGSAGTLTMAGRDEAVTVELTSEDLRALSETFSSAYYSTLPELTA